MKSRQIVFDIHRLKEEGYSKRSIARVLGIGRNTVSRYLMSPDKTPAKRNLQSKLDPFKDQIDRLLNQDATVSVKGDKGVKSL